MTTTMLTGLVAAAERQTARRRSVRADDEITRRALSAPAARDFAAALAEPGLGVIAEMKRRSPSRGALTRSYQPKDLAAKYERGGAAAISVLTHEDGFGGSPEHLRAVRAETALPLLRKDFIVDDYQVWEARALGADAVLLIVAALPEQRLGELLDRTRRLGMEALVEVHTEAEVDAAMAAGARVIGVNHRDLHTFSIDMTRTERLRGRVGRSRLLVGESGVRSAEDARRLRTAGADATLVGETLMSAVDPETKLKELSEA
ncbi:indole-3-glycerol phosphate synthase TrpC [Parasphingorhabdus pacifica]